jgi:hypothetical protein
MAQSTFAKASADNAGLSIPGDSGKAEFKLKW